MNPLITLLLLVTCIAFLAALVLMPLALARLQPWRKRRRGEIACANIAEGTHVESITRLADAAIARNLLLKVGSDAKHVAVCTASTVPIGVSEDESAAAEDLLGLHLLGVTRSTRLMVANAAISAGAQVYTAAAGKVSPLSATPATYYCVGTALTTVTTDGDLVEVATSNPQKTVVT